jgi:23S rRNA pseudouridine1911/1915/1917 synthase
VTNPPHSITINAETAYQRLDQFLKNEFPEFTRSYLQNLISRKCIEVNDRVVKSGYKLKPADRVKVTFPDPESSHIAPENIPIQIVYEDESIIVIDKPPGLVVHPGAGNKSGTLVNALLYHCGNLSGINGVLRPGIVHRLDKNTSGLIVVAKNDKSHLFLTRQFETREIKRTYQSIVWGIIGKRSGQIDTLIDRSTRDRKKMSVSDKRGRQAVTNFEVVEELQYHTLLQLNLETGRTHQIRVHLNYINHPVFGDAEYNGRLSQIDRIPSGQKKYVQNVLKNMNRQALHATNLSFLHPDNKQRVSFHSNLPVDMQQTLDLLHNI